MFQAKYVFLILLLFFFVFKTMKMKKWIIFGFISKFAQYHKYLGINSI